MSEEIVRPEAPMSGAEREQLAGFLDWQRAARHVGHLDLVREMIDGRTGQ